MRTPHRPGVSARGHGEYDVGKLIGASGPQWLAWVLGTATGLILAPSPALIHTYGLDTALPAFFMVLAIAEMRRPPASAWLGSPARRECRCWWPSCRVSWPPPSCGVG